MSKYGIKIKNYEAASLYECYWGFRQYPDTENAMLSNSLFKDFLIEQGMEVRKDGSSRDIICLAFSYKTKGYDELIEKVPKLFTEDIAAKNLNCLSDSFQILHRFAHAHKNNSV